jgi:hypothetical protein
VKFLKYAVLIVAVTGSLSCKPSVTPNPLCPAVGVGITGGASAIVAVLDCKNIAAIAADLTATVDGLLLCAAAPKANGLVGSLVCPAVGAFVATAVKNAVPATWQCTGGAAVDQVGSLVTAACEKVVP